MNCLSGNNKERPVYQTRHRATVLKFSSGHDAPRTVSHRLTRAIQWGIALLLLCGLPSTQAADLRVAVATNFNRTATVLAHRFEQQSQHAVHLIFGSTGKHYAQITHGAPFEVFLAADERRPALLEKKGLAIPGTRFTYAQGRLVLWSPDADRVDTKGDVLANGNFRKLAIANPKLAPYGFAAREILQARGLWEKLQPRLVRGENIGQAYQFVRTGNAQLGFVAAAQIFAEGNLPDTGSWWAPPQSLYTPVIQQAVLIKDTPAAQAFIRFVKSDEARTIIRQHGYDTP